MDLTNAAERARHRDWLARIGHDALAERCLLMEVTLEAVRIDQRCADGRIAALTDWSDEVMLTICNALGIHPDSVDRDDDTEALAILRDLCEQKAAEVTEWRERAAALEAAIRHAVASGQPLNWYYKDVARCVWCGCFAKRENHYNLCPWTGLTAALPSPPPSGGRDGQP